MKTQEEIKTAIKELKNVRPKVRPRSAFGDDNLAALDAQVEVLEQSLDNDDIYARFDCASSTEEILMSALEARQWIDGDSDVDNLAADYPLD